ncbi:MAG TPA: hypothetical protein VK665_15225 [Candidatus Elarobacter sp.]|nr:hypothetical protein [Candidatus Elarobacter sp.]
MVTQSLIALVVAAIVVFRFAARELKPRVIKASTLWLRPGLVVVLTAWLIWTTLTVDPAGSGQLAIAVAAGAVAGVVTGVLIVRYTSFSPAGIPNAVMARGSKVTFGIWLAAFVLRFLARYLVPHGADARTQLPMNSGTVTLVAVAFLVIAIAFQREIARFSAART